jgi:hypothetical protein
MEGALSIDGRLIEVGALTWDTLGPIPVLMAEVGSEILGMATDFRRHPDGMISADIYSDRPIPAGFFSIATNHIEYYRDQNNVMHFTSGQIRSVILVETWLWELR